MTPAQEVTEADRRPTSLFAAIRGVLVTPVAWFSNLSDKGAGRAVRIAMLVQLVAAGLERCLAARPARATTSPPPSGSRL